MTTSSPFRRQLEEALGARHSRLNSFTETWRNGELSPAQLGGWVSQHVLYVSQFSRWCATMYGGCSDPEARDVERHATTAAAQVEAVEAVREAAEMRWQYLAGVYRAYVLKEEM